MIKKFNEFVNNMSLGEIVESLYDDDYIKNIVNRFIGEIPPDIEISNAINLLDEKQQADIRGQIKRYQEDGIEDKDITMISSVNISESQQQKEEVIDDTNTEIVSPAGKSTFTSFLKSLTALGQKEKQINSDKCPSQFLIFYLYDKLYSNDVKSIFDRFKSLSRYTNLIDYGNNEVSLYFGIKNDGTLEYGVAYETLLPIGTFKLSKSTIKWVIQIDSKSAQSLKKEIVNLSYQDIILLGKIKNEMANYKPGYFSKVSKPIIRDSVISFGYYGIGNWSNGNMDPNDLETFKNHFSSFVANTKWGKKVKISVKPESFWLYLNVKLK